MTAQPIGDPSRPLKNFLRSVRATEADLARILALTARESESIIRSAGTSPSSTVRRAQIQASLNRIRAMSDAMWGGALNDAIEIGKARAIDVAGKTAAQQLHSYMKETGRGRFMTLRQWEQSLAAQAERGIEALIAQGANDIPLAKSVYHNRKLADDSVRDIVRTRLATGTSARDIARAVRSTIRPDVPGGVSYAAMRLGRTEINNAFHTATIGHWSTNPFVNQMVWRISGSHPRPDICNELESNSPYDSREVPSKPHPQCFCVVIPSTDSDDDIARKFRNGDYDSWLDEQIEASGNPIPFGDSQYGTMLLQRRVMRDGKATPIKDVPESFGSAFFTDAEKSAIRGTGQWPW